MAEQDSGPGSTGFASEHWQFHLGGVARGGAGGANAPPQIFVVPLLPKTLIQLYRSTLHIIPE